MKLLTTSFTFLLTSLLALSFSVSYATTTNQGSTAIHSSTGSHSDNNNSSNDTVVAPPGANNSTSPIVAQTQTDVTYHLGNLNFTLPKLYQLQKSDYAQQLFFANNTNHSILAIQTQFVPKAEIFNNFIPQVKDNTKLTQIVAADLTNVLKNIIFEPKAYIKLNPLVKISDRNIITYTGYITVNKINNANPNNPDITKTSFNVSGAEIYYGQYLYLTFTLAPKLSVPFDNATILNQNIKVVLDHLQTLPLPATPPAGKELNNNIPPAKAETGNNLPPSTVE